MTNSNECPKRRTQMSHLDHLFVGAIRSIINHYWDDERCDFLATKPELRRNHVFTHFQVVALCLDSGGDAQLAPMREDDIF